MEETERLTEARESRRDTRPLFYQKEDKGYTRNNKRQNIQYLLNKYTNRK